MKFGADVLFVVSRPLGDVTQSAAKWRVRPNGDWNVKRTFSWIFLVKGALDETNLIDD